MAHIWCTVLVITRSILREEVLFVGVAFCGSIEFSNLLHAESRLKVLPNLWPKPIANSQPAKSYTSACCKFEGTNVYQGWQRV